MEHYKSWFSLIPVENLFLHFSFSVDYNRAVNWSSNTLDTLPSNIAKFLYHLLVKTEQIKDFETFTYVFITSVQLPTSFY
jgi:hypothetical protein